MELELRLRGGDKDKKVLEKPPKMALLTFSIHKRSPILPSQPGLLHANPPPLLFPEDPPGQLPLTSFLCGRAAIKF
jgi:hypothetical protein